MECGSGAVVAKGCNTHTRVATAEAARSRRAIRASLGAHGGMSYRRCQPPGMSRPPQRWLGSAVGSLKVSPPGVVRNKASNTARGTPEKWRTCGLQIGRRFIEKHRPAQVSREAEARGSVRTPASRAALTFAALLDAKLGRKTRRENESG